MVLPEVYHRLGQALLYGFIPLYVLTTLWFVLRRRYFPISGRYPKLSMAQLVGAFPWFFFISLYFYRRVDIPCAPAFWFYSPGSSVFLHTLALRCTCLLVQCEVTKDLAMAERTRAATRERQQAVQRAMRDIDDDGDHGPQQHDDGSPPDNIHASSPNPPAVASPKNHYLRSYWTPSFWTRHRYWLRGATLQRIILALIGAYLLVDFATAHLITSVTDMCEASPELLLFRRIALQCHAVLALPSALLLAVVTWHLRKHAADAYGLMNEFRFSAVSVLMGVFAAIIGGAIGDLQFALIIRPVWILATNTQGWLGTCIWPLYLSYRHQRLMAARLHIISNVTRLADLLAVEEGYTAFLIFTQREFNSEGVLFYKRVNDFRDSHTTSTTVPATSSTMTGFKQPQLVSIERVAISSSANHNPNHSNVSGAPHNPSNNNNNNNDSPPMAGSSSAATSTLSIHHHILLSLLIEATAIHHYYVDHDAPNELMLSTAMRSRAYGSLNSITMRAATAGNLRIHDTPVTPAPSAVPSPVRSSLPLVRSSSPLARDQTASPTIASLGGIGSQPSHPSSGGSGVIPLPHQPSPTQPALTRRGISISASLSTSEAIELIAELRVIFDECQHAVVERLDALSFQRFRASDAYQSVLAKLRGFTVDTRHAAIVKPLPYGPVRAVARGDHYGHGHAHDGSNATNDNELKIRVIGPHSNASVLSGALVFGRTSHNGTNDGLLSQSGGSGGGVGPGDPSTPVAHADGHAQLPKNDDSPPSAYRTGMTSQSAELQFGGPNNKATSPIIKSLPHQSSTATTAAAATAGMPGVTSLVPSMPVSPSLQTRGGISLPPLLLSPNHQQQQRARSASPQSSLLPLTAFAAPLAHQPPAVRVHTPPLTIPTVAMRYHYHDASDDENNDGTNDDSSRRMDHPRARGHYHHNDASVNLSSNIASTAVASAASMASSSMPHLPSAFSIPTAAAVVSLSQPRS